MRKHEDACYKRTAREREKQMKTALIALALIGGLGLAACDNSKQKTEAEKAADTKAAADKAAADKAAADTKAAADKAAAENKAAADKAAEDAKAHEPPKTTP